MLVRLRRCASERDLSQPWFLTTGQAVASGSLQGHPASSQGAQRHRHAPSRRSYRRGTRPTRVGGPARSHRQPACCGFALRLSPRLSSSSTHPSSPTRSRVARPATWRRDLLLVTRRARRASSAAKRPPRPAPKIDAEATAASKSPQSEVEEVRDVSPPGVVATGCLRLAPQPPHEGPGPRPSRPRNACLP